MSGGLRRPAPAGGAGVAAGLWRLALLRPDGVACFAATREALLASFTPWIAVGIVLAILQLSVGRPLAGLSMLLQLVCVVLATPVLSQLLLQLWRQEAGWLRFATVYVWSQWLPNLLAFLLGLVADVALSAGVDPHLAIGLPILAWVAYALRLNWLVARTALGTGWVRTLLLLLWMGVGVSAILLGPSLLSQSQRASSGAPGSSAPEPSTQGGVRSAGAGSAGTGSAA